MRVCFHRQWMGMLAVTFLTNSLARAAEPPITALAFAPQPSSIVAVSQAGLQEYSWPELRSTRTIDCYSSNLHTVAFSPDGHYLAVGGGNPSEVGTVEIYSWPDAKRLTVIDFQDDSVMDVIWHHIRTNEQSNTQNPLNLIAASHDRSVRSFATNATLVRSFEGHSRGVSSVCLLPDRETLVSAGEDQSVRVWELATGKLIRSLSQHTKSIEALAVRPSQSGLAMVASAAGDRTIRFWQPTIGRMVRYVRLESEPLDIAWSRDGDRIFASCVDGTLREVDPLQVKQLRKWSALKGWAYCVATHPSDGSAAVGGAGGQLVRIETN